MDTAETTFKRDVFSECQSYRYLVERQWDRGSNPLVVITLNPSTADYGEDDAVTRRAIRLSKTWGFDSLNLVNLFAFRTDDPTVLMRVSDPIGPDNETVLRHYTRTAGPILIAWGKGGIIKDQDAKTLLKIRRPKCLGHTRYGHPKHLLHASANAQIRDYRPLEPLP